MATAGAHTASPSRSNTRPTTMTILQSSAKSNGFDHYSGFNSGKSVQRNRWTPLRKENVQTAMELLPAEDDEASTDAKDSRCRSADVVRPSSAGSARPGSAGSAASRPGSSGSSRRAPPIQRADSAGSSGRRTPSTPTKQVTLQAVPRKQDRGEDVPEKLNWAEHRLQDDLRLGSHSPVDKSLNPEMRNMSLMPHSTPDNSMKVLDLETSSGSEEDSSEDSSTEEEPVKAPNELFMEFVTCVQKEDYVNGKKLCEMILLYEPDHLEALKFQSLIDEKIDLEVELAEQSSDESDSDEESDETDDEEDDDDDEESGDSGDEESQSSTDSSSSEEDDDEPDTSNSIAAALEIPQ